MVLNRRIADSSLHARPKFKIKQTLMEPVSGVLPITRNNKNLGKRWKLGGSSSSSSTTTATTTPGNVIVNAAAAAAGVSTSGGKSTMSGMTVPSVTSAQPTTHQKVRRILEEHAIWQERANNGHQPIRPRGHSPSSSSPSNVPILGNYNIVASRGELSRGSFSIQETPAPTSSNVTRKARVDVETRNGIFVNGREDSSTRINARLQNGEATSRIQHSPSNWEKRAASRDNSERSTSKTRSSRNCGQSAGILSKSSSVPANLKSGTADLASNPCFCTSSLARPTRCSSSPRGVESYFTFTPKKTKISGSSVGLDAAGNLGTFVNKNSGEGILRKSSAFLASLTHSSTKNINDRKSNGNVSVLRAIEKDIDVSWREPDRRQGKSRFAILRRNSPFVTSRRHDDDNHGLHRSPSCQNLSISGKKKGISRGGVKKSVSFSSDTSFEEKRAPFRKTAVHEAKVYRKGVLRDLNATENAIKRGPETSDSSSGDPKALLRASREADSHILTDLVWRIRRSGLGQMDVNATDSSGRTAISYMAGNGSPAMLEATLSFAGSDPNLPDNEGNTPLHFAAQAGQTECLNILLQRCPGIEVDARNVLGFTPLMKAALQGRTKCAKVLLFAGANPTLRDHGRGLRAEQWARYCGRHFCADVIERFAKHRAMEKNTTCRWGSEPELATKVLQGKVIPVPAHPLPPPSTGFRSKIRQVFRTTSGPDRSFSLVSQLTSAALCASTPALPKPGEVTPLVKSLIRPLSVPQLRVTLVGSQDIIERTTDKCGSNFTEKIESSITKPPRSKKKNK